MRDDFVFWLYGANNQKESAKITKARNQLPTHPNQQAPGKNPHFSTYHLQLTPPPLPLKSWTPSFGFFPSRLWFHLPRHGVPSRDLCNWVGAGGVNFGGGQEHWWFQWYFFHARSDITLHISGLRSNFQQQRCNEQEHLQHENMASQTF